jgi:hypothetical protein
MSIVNNILICFELPEIVVSCDKKVYGPTYLDFFGPKWHSLFSIPYQGSKKFQLSGPTLPMALEMDLPQSKSVRPAPYKQQVQYIN